MQRADRLIEERMQRGWSQARVAELPGTDAGNVSRWERGYSSPCDRKRGKALSVTGREQYRFRKRSVSMQHVFPLGTIVISPSATEALAADQQTVSTLLARHGQGDWGLFPFQANEQALRRQHPLTSVYPLTDGTHIIVITNAERTRTRLLINKEIPSQEVSALEGYAMWASFYEKNSLIAVEECFVDTILAPLNPRVALDVGTGTGRHALKLARRGIAVSAVDQSPEMLALARS